MASSPAGGNLELLGLTILVTTGKYCMTQVKLSTQGPKIAILGHFGGVDGVQKDNFNGYMHAVVVQVPYTPSNQFILFYIQGKISARGGKISARCEPNDRLFLGNKCPMIWLPEGRKRRQPACHFADQMAASSKADPPPYQNLWQIVSWGKFFFSLILLGQIAKHSLTLIGIFGKGLAESAVPRKRTKKDGGEGLAMGLLTEFEDTILNWLDWIEAWFNQLVKEETEDEEGEEEDEDEDMDLSLNTAEWAK
ncbi:hypothetical protein BT96DRAFT_945942 [Gymnopus androsaceus JB14]|uniref:Uncharacterized protein n=1 Tax=Gymnopus androsaceus JB14 TaxID=1447944 RepID=A0A6A4GXQ6_9AGAR|nr:hypothetical protein BT96DRAFT_945942 [Gymnopus androsaceus JB14]